MRATLIILLFVASQVAQALPNAGNASCVLKGSTFVLDIGQAKVPTYAAVVLPDGRMLRLRYPPENIDTLGPQYAKGYVSILVKDLIGVNGKLRHETVFKVPGTYRFMMQDANTAEGMELHRLQCSITLTKVEIG